MEGEAEPLAPGDTNEFGVELWDDWEKTRLRSVFDREPDAEDEIRERSHCSAPTRQE